MARLVIISIPAQQPWMNVPHEAARLAAALEQAGGDDPRILDLTLLSVNDLLARVRELNPDAAVLWLGRGAGNRFHELYRPLRETLPEAPLLAVGPGVQPESLVFHSEGLLDGAVIGDYNEVVLEMARRRQAPVEMPGVAMVDEDGALVANKPGIDSDPDEWGLPAYHLVEIGRYSGLARPGFVFRGVRYWTAPVDRRMPEKITDELSHLVAQVNVDEVVLTGGGGLTAAALTRLLEQWQTRPHPEHLAWLEPLPAASWTAENIALFNELGGYQLAIKVAADELENCRRVARFGRRKKMLIRGWVHSDAPRQAVRLLNAAGVDMAHIISRSGSSPQAEKLARRFYRGRRRWRLWRSPAVAPVEQLRATLLLPPL